MIRPRIVAAAAMAVLAACFASPTRSSAQGLRDRIENRSDLRDLLSDRLQSRDDLRDLILDRLTARAALCDLQRDRVRDKRGEYCA